MLHVHVVDTELSTDLTLNVLKRLLGHFLFVTELENTFQHCLYCIEKTMFYNVYTNHVGEKTLENFKNKSLHCSPVIYIFLR